MLAAKGRAARLDAELIRQKLSEGLTPSRIALQLDCSISAIQVYRRRFLEAGQIPKPQPKPQVNLWATNPDERPPPRYIRFATRTWPKLSDVRLQVQQWEERTMMKLGEGWDDESPNGDDELMPPINLECVSADLQTDMPLARAAGKYGVPAEELRAQLQAAGLPISKPDGRRDDETHKVTLAQVRADHEAGLSLTAIANKRDCDVRRVRRLVESAGLTGVKPSEKANGKTGASDQHDHSAPEPDHAPQAPLDAVKPEEPGRPTLAQIRADQAAGMSFRSIAQKFNCSRDYVYRTLRNAGLTNSQSTAKVAKPRPSGKANGKRSLPKPQTASDRALQGPQRARATAMPPKDPTP
jgi:transposase